MRHPATHQSDASHGFSCAQTEIQIDHSSGAYYEINATPSTSTGSAQKTSEKLKKAEITLNDCLACSGCVTSAESVLVALQSQDEVYKVLAERPVSTAATSECGCEIDRLTGCGLSAGCHAHPLNIATVTSFSRSIAPSPTCDMPASAARLLPPRAWLPSGL